MDYHSIMENLKEKFVEDNINREILEPYLEEEIIAFENHLGEKLPQDFRNYLLNVSKDIFVNTYPVTVDYLLPKYNKNITLALLERENNHNNILAICQVCNNDFSNECYLKDFMIPEDLDIWFYHGFRDKIIYCPKCNNEYKYCCNKCNIKLKGGIIEIGNGGCCYVDYLVIKGPHKGSVWNIDDDGGNKFRKTFTEYIL